MRVNGLCLLFELRRGVRLGATDERADTGVLARRAARAAPEFMLASQINPRRANSTSLIAGTNNREQLRNGLNPRLIKCPAIRRPDARGRTVTVGEFG
jgi:hypothetical protein